MLIAQQRARLEDQDARWKAQRAQIEAQRAQIEDHKGQLAEHRARLEDLHARLEDLHARLEEQKASLADKDARLQRQAEEMARLVNQVTRQHAQANRMKEQLRKLGRQAKRPTSQEGQEGQEGQDKKKKRVKVPECDVLVALTTGCVVCCEPATIGCGTRDCPGVCTGCFLDNMAQNLKLEKMPKDGVLSWSCLACYDGSLHPGRPVHFLTGKDLTRYKAKYEECVLEAGDPAEARRGLEGAISEALIRRTPCCNRPFEFDHRVQCTAIGCSSCRFSVVLDSQETKMDTQFCFFCLATLPAPTTHFGADPAHEHVKSCRFNPKPGEMYLQDPGLYHEFLAEDARRRLEDALARSRSKLGMVPAEYAEPVTEFKKKYL